MAGSRGQKLSAMPLSLLFNKYLWIGLALVGLLAYVEYLRLENRALTAEVSTYKVVNLQCKQSIEKSNEAVQNLQDEAAKRSKQSKAALGALQKGIIAKEAARKRLEANLAKPAPKVPCPADEALKTIREQSCVGSCAHF